MSVFVLPDLGEGLQDAEIVSWHVTPGDHVVADQPLVAVETDKAVVEIPAPRAGRIAAIHGAEGDIVRVGAPLVEFSDAEGADVGTVVGVLPESAASPASPRSPEHPIVPRASPAIRRRAAEAGIDLGSVTPSGPEGTITMADLEPGRSEPDGILPRPEPLRGFRRVMARAMMSAHREVVPATVTDEADIGRWASDQDPTVRLIRAIVIGCAVVPAVNTHLLGSDIGRVVHGRVDLGLAMDTPEGLIVPVLRDAGRYGPTESRGVVDRLKTAVLARAVPPEDLRGATITLSNFGPLGGRHAHLVVLPPQVAIVGAGRIFETVRVQNGAMSMTRALPISLTFDHRAVTGGEAARFLAALIADLELRA